MFNVGLQSVFLHNLAQMWQISIYAYFRSMIGQSYCDQFHSVFLSSPVFKPFTTYNSEIITSIELKFVGRYFKGYRWIPLNLMKFD